MCSLNQMSKSQGIIISHYPEVLICNYALLYQINFYAIVEGLIYLLCMEIIYILAIFLEENVPGLSVC